MFLCGLRARARAAGSNGSEIRCRGGTLLGIALANAVVIPKNLRGPRGGLRHRGPLHYRAGHLASRLSDLKRAGWSLGPVLRPRTGSGASGGAFAASLLFHRMLGRNLENGGSPLPGAFVGGGMNFRRSDGACRCPDLFAAAFVADNLSTVPTCCAGGVVCSLSRYYRKLPRQAPPAAGEGARPDEIPRYWSSAEISITDLALCRLFPWERVFVAPAFPLLPVFPKCSGLRRWRSSRLRPPGRAS